jgi:hypothetical protein
MKDFATIKAEAAPFLAADDRLLGNGEKGDYDDVVEGVIIRNTHVIDFRVGGKFGISVLQLAVFEGGKYKVMSSGCPSDLESIEAVERAGKYIRAFGLTNGRIDKVYPSGSAGRAKAGKPV